jgi:dihydrolipoamide dehydrogenase
MLLKADGTLETIEAKKHHYTTGSKPSSLPFIKIDKENHHFYRSFETEHLYWWWSYRNRIRSSVFTIGSASFCCRIFRPNIPGMDASLSKELTKVLKQGMKFYVSHKVKSVERNGEGVVVQAENARRNYYAGRRLFISFCWSPSV